MILKKLNYSENSDDLVYILKYVSRFSFMIKAYKM